MNILEENGALGKKFDAYPKRQFVTESININSLAYHHTWSTIKTLPATLPELRAMDRGPRTGVTGALIAMFFQHEGKIWNVGDIG